jgi:DNA polymerase-4
MDRVILHCDLNNFYASVELLSLPELHASGKPVAVCGDPEARHGVILAKNEAAKAHGVKTAETVWQAQKKCPDLVLLAAHHGEYIRWSKVVNSIYNRFTDLVEPFSGDESWLDITGSAHLWGGDGAHVANLVRQTVKQETGLTVSVGVSFNKVFAKMGSDYKKPDATTVITRKNFRDLLWPLPVTDLLFVGKAAAAVLAGYGVRTIGDLAAFGREGLVSLLGKKGAVFYDYATGAEHSPVSPADARYLPKSVGNGLTFRRNLLGVEDVRTGVAALADDVATRLRQHGLKCTTVQVTIRDPNFKDISRQKPLSIPSYTAREIGGAAFSLILSFWNMRRPIRALTVTGQNLVAEEDVAEQLSLFPEETVPHRDKLERLSHTMDKIRAKYGEDSITFTSSVKEELGLTSKSKTAPPDAG